MYFWSVSLVDQLSGQFHIFWSTNFFFWSSNFFFYPPKTIFSYFWATNFFFFGRPNLFLVNQKKIGRPKKMRNRPNNWSTKRLTKSTWTPPKIAFYARHLWGLISTFFLFCPLSPRPLTHFYSFLQQNSPFAT